MNKSEKPKKNYQKETERIIQELLSKESKLTNDSLCKKPTLLLHACCGPCSSYVLEYLFKYFDITVFYYNPNIFPPQEYERRLTELKDLYKKFPPALEGNVKVVEAAYNPEDFYTAVGTRENPELANEPEKGERCKRCYEFRLRRAFSYAWENQFDYFCTTLSISPFKDAQKLNTIGEELEKEAKDKMIASCSGDTDSKSFEKKVPAWLASDFKKKGGFKRSLEISEEYGMYRQDYCGCIYSKNQRKSDIM